MTTERSSTEAQRRLTVEEGACCPLGVTWIPLITADCSPYLKRFYERVKARRGAGRAIIALARKFLGIIYRTLKSKWVFEDFTNFGRRMRRLRDSPPAIQAVFSSGEQNQVEVGNIIGVIDMTTQTPTPQTDPVCGMQVDPNRSAGTSEHAGKTYHFCSSGCKTKFEKNPKEYVRA